MTHEIGRAIFTMEDRFGREWNVLLMKWADGVTTVDANTDAGSPYMDVLYEYELEFTNDPTPDELMSALMEAEEDRADASLPN
jgi:hypothetical protein